MFTLSKVSTDENCTEKYFLADWSDSYFFFQETNEFEANVNSIPGPTYYSAFLARGKNDLDGDIDTNELILVGSIVRLIAGKRGSRGSGKSGGGDNFVLATIRKDEGLSSKNILAGVYGASFVGVAYRSPSSIVRGPSGSRPSKQQLQKAMDALEASNAATIPIDDEEDIKRPRPRRLSTQKDVIEKAKAVDTITPSSKKHKGTTDSALKPGRAKAPSSKDVNLGDENRRETIDDALPPPTYGQLLKSENLTKVGASASYRQWGNPLEITLDWGKRGISLQKPFYGQLRLKRDRGLIMISMSLMNLSKLPIFISRRHQKGSALARAGRTNLLLHERTYHFHRPHFSHRHHRLRERRHRRHRHHRLRRLKWRSGLSIETKKVLHIITTWLPKSVHGRNLFRCRRCHHRHHRHHHLRRLKRRSGLNIVTTKAIRITTTWLPIRAHGRNRSR